MYEPKIGVVKQIYETKIVHTKFNVTKKVWLFCFYFLNYEKGSFDVELLYTHGGGR